MKYEVWVNGSYIKGFDNLKKAKRYANSLTKKAWVKKEYKIQKQIGDSYFMLIKVNQIEVCKGNENE